MLTNLFDNPEEVHRKSSTNCVFKYIYRKEYIFHISIPNLCYLFGPPIGSTRMGLVNKEVRFPLFSLLKELELKGLDTLFGHLLMIITCVDHIICIKLICDLDLVSHSRYESPYLHAGPHKYKRGMVLHEPCLWGDTYHSTLSAGFKPR